jgi:hypothetical protein
VGCSAFEHPWLCLFFERPAAYDFSTHSTPRSVMKSTDFSSPTRLQPGQSLRLALDAGAALMVLEGNVRVVSPPSWFGETAFTVKNDYQEGEVYVAERGGWVEVEALTPALIRGLPQPAPVPALRPSPVARLLRLLLA